MKLLNFLYSILMSYTLFMMLALAIMLCFDTVFTMRFATGCFLVYRALHYFCVQVISQGRRMSK